MQLYAPGHVGEIARMVKTRKDMMTLSTNMKLQDDSLRCFYCWFKEAKVA